MRQGKLGWHFDLSTTFILGLMAVVLVSLPGGCWDDEGADDAEEPTAEAAMEPTPPPMMEIVEPEPSVNQPTPSTDQDASGSEGDTPEGETEPDESDEVEQGEQPEGEQPGDEEPATQDGTYVVQQGDTLFDIAIRLGVTVDALAQENGIDDQSSLQVGQVLRIPE